MNKGKILKKILRKERTLTEVSEKLAKYKIKYEELEEEVKLLYADLHMPYTSSVNLLDLPYFEKHTGSKNISRDIFIMKEWNDNLDSTLQSIANKHDLTRERVRQILERWEDVGYTIREPEKRTEFRRKKQIDSVHEEIVKAIESCYGTPEFTKWKRDFYRKSNLWQRRYFQKVLRNYWKEGKADPLLYMDSDIKLNERHYEVLKMKKSGMTQNEISVKLGVSEQVVGIAIRDLKDAHLVAHKNAKQVESVSLSKEEIERRLDKIRSKIISGVPISKLDQKGNVLKKQHSTQAMHFVRRHFLKPLKLGGQK
jgi:DNA-binding CsgD family transcriptional regulator